MTPRSPAGEALPFVPGVTSPRGSSSSFLGVLSPKVNWGGVDSALASGCWKAVSRSWSIRLIVADNSVRLMKAASTLFYRHGGGERLLVIYIE